MGMQLIGGIYTPESGYSLQPCPGGVCPDGLQEKPLSNFDYCMPAMLSVFILVTGEWVQPMQGAADVVGPAIAGFYIPIVLIGKFLLMNLLVAVILNEFQQQGDQPTPRSDAVAIDEDNDEEDKGRRPNSPRWPKDYSLLCFEPKHPLRSTCRSLLEWPGFDRIILVAIVVSSICLAVDSPRLDPESDIKDELLKLDLIFTAIFFGEMCIKVVAFGFFFGRESYLSSAWNVIDFTIVTTSILVLLADSVEELHSLKILRVLRVLRPLRLISRASGMKLIITSLFRAMPGVSNVFGVVLFLQVLTPPPTPNPNTNRTPKPKPQPQPQPQPNVVASLGTHPLPHGHRASSR